MTRVRRAPPTAPELFDLLVAGRTDEAHRALGSYLNDARDEVVKAVDTR